MRLGDPKQGIFWGKLRDRAILTPYNDVQTSGKGDKQSKWKTSVEFMGRDFLQMNASLYVREHFET